MTFIESVGSFLVDVKRKMPLTYTYKGKKWSGRSYDNLVGTVDDIQRARQALLASGKYTSLAEIARAEEENMLKNGWQGNEAAFLTEMLTDGTQQLRAGRRMLFPRTEKPSHITIINLENRLR